ncbi:MAG: hypothetical protein K2L07_06650 [Lachnospiraceae bacterium]|nr:hypothetical protein [Lachnospiraceae bacterium]
MDLQKMKKILKKVFILPPVPTLLVSIPCYVLVIYVLSNGGMHPVISYAAYILSAYALIITCTGTPSIIKRLRKWITSHPLTRRLLGISLIKRFVGEVSFQTEVSLYQGLFINIMYIGIKLFSGIYYRSIWFTALSIYYIFLAAMRFSLIHYMRRQSTGKDMAAEWRRYRLCGIILLCMNQALIGIIVLVVHQNSGFEYPGLLIYAMALYAFYAAITAVVNVVKFRKYGSPIMSSAKVINLTAALVSMLSLETAMMAQFGTGDDASFRQIMSACTGAGVSMIVVGMAVYMVIRSTKILKQISKEQGGNAG